MANNNDGNTGGRSNRGFAAMDPREQREIARKGGEAVSQDREHMAAIGRKGGEASHGRRNEGAQQARTGRQEQKNEEED
jgi:general stress protein YciG